MMTARLMKRLVPCCLFLACASALAAKHPNVLVIYSDDHGWADLGAQGVNADIRTPHLDQLAHDGVRCVRGYVSAPQCVPSRAGVITGRHQQRFGVEDNTKGPLPLEEVTLAERLKAAGYVTGQVGKWHLDLPPDFKGQKKRILTEHMPHGQGFDEYWRGEMKRYFASHDLKGQPFADAPHAVDDNRFRISVQTEAALSFLDRRVHKPEQPWLLYLAYYTPHVPLESPEPWFSKTPAHLPKERRQALAMIAAMDEGIGQVRTRIQELGQEKDTLIFFIGDNGAPVKAGHWDGSLNKPLVGEKGMLTDGGVRVPFLVAWPGTLPAGVVYEHPVMNLDVTATAVAAAALPQDEKLDGVNLLPYLQGKEKVPPHQHLFWRWRSQSAILEMPWKLIRLGPEEQFLFDVTNPEGETKNVAAQHPELVARLGRELEHWSQGLKPLGLAKEDHPEDLKFYGEHLEARFTPEPKKKAKAAAVPGSVQGWLCRNGSLAVEQGALLIKADAQATAAPFLACTGLDLQGPLTLTARVRAQQGGSAAVSWRAARQQDFVKAQRVAGAWPSGSDWHDVTFRIEEKQRIIHLRLHAPEGGVGLEVQSITAKPEVGEPQVWRFDAMPK